MFDPIHVRLPSEEDREAILLNEIYDYKTLGSYTPSYVVPLKIKEMVKNKRHTPRSINKVCKTHYRICFLIIFDSLFP